MNDLVHKLCCLFLALLIVGAAQAQASLSFQGILKKSSGVAVEDGTYNITFNLYDVAQGGTPLWTENQPEVEVTNGIYSVLLGTDTLNPLDVAFDKVYYMGIKVGSAEMTPRFKLTSAPYALSLIGQSNLFPSTGTVKADSLQVQGKITAAGIRARGGAPGLNGVDNNGYAFQGNGGDNDSGLFSTGDGAVSLFVNNTEQLKVTEGGVEIATTTKINGDLNLGANGAIVYNGLKDWRLVQVDSFGDNDYTDGWKAYSSAIESTPVSSGIESFEPNSDFTDWTIRPKNYKHFLKKQINLPGEYQEIKVVFTCYYLGPWDQAGYNAVFAGFQKNIYDKVTVAWYGRGHYNYGWPNWQNLDPIYNANAQGNYLQAEMVAHYDQKQGAFWICFGGIDVTAELYAIGGIEFWVR